MVKYPIHGTGCLLNGGDRGLDECYRLLVSFAVENGWAAEAWADEIGSVLGDSEKLARHLTTLSMLDAGWVTYLADDALEWINENMVAPGLRCDWHEGSVMCWSDEEWAEEAPSFRLCSDCVQEKITNERA